MAEKTTEEELQQLVEDTKNDPKDIIEGEIGNQMMVKVCVGEAIYIPIEQLNVSQEELDRIKTIVPVFIDSPLGLKITKIYSKTIRRSNFRSTSW